MDGRAIGAGALADSGPRQLASEMNGPRPAGVERSHRTSGGERVSQATNDARTLRPAKP
ncbi:MAG: hypothetical protein JWL74_1049 [Alphaproteobacteria bacterium]|jgi:hypothetical protein|nr:hypothetical protein [Alphaproteobacteria bacterium]